MKRGGALWQLGRQGLQGGSLLAGLAAGVCGCRAAHRASSHELGLQTGTAASALPRRRRVDEDKRGQREPGSSLVRRALRQVYSPGTLLDGLMLVGACLGSSLGGQLRAAWRQQLVGMLQVVFMLCSQQTEPC